MKTAFIALVTLVIGIGIGAAGTHSTLPTRDPQLATPAAAAPAPKAAQPTNVPRSRVTLTGNSDQKTKPVELHGNYTLDYSTAADRAGGNLMIRLVPTNGGYGDSLANTITKAGTPYSSTTQIYSADGIYYFDVVAMGDWTLTVTPL